MEFPPSTLRILGKNIPVEGRISKASADSIYRMGNAFNKQKETQSAIVYFHPWEIDLGAACAECGMEDKNPPLYKSA